MLDPANDDQLIAWFGRLAEWDARRGGPEITKSIRFGPHPEQAIDFWTDGSLRMPNAVVAIHGGYFMEAFDRQTLVPMVREWVRRGIPVLNIEYRRHGCGGGFHETTSDVWTAVDAIVREFGVKSLAVVGHSAGGYLSQWLAPHPSVSLVLPLASICDLASGSRSGLDEGAIARWMGAEVDENPGLYEESRILPRLSPDSPRQVLFHGNADTIVDIGQSRDFAARAVAAGVQCRLVELAGDGHFGFLDPKESAFLRVTSEIETWHRGLL